jgi:AraC-like DNA-binding protein
MTAPLNNLILAFLGYSVQRDLSPEYLCRLSGIDFDGLSKNQSVDLSDKQLNDLWLNAADLSGDEYIGLHFGESLQLAALGIVGQIIQVSTSVGEALTQAASMIGLITDLFSMEVVFEKKDKIEVKFLPVIVKADQYPDAFRHLMDMSMVFVLHELDGLLLKKMRPDAVKMPFKKIVRFEEYYRLLRIGYIGNSKEYRLSFPGEYRDLPLITSNYELQRILLDKLSLTSGSTAKGLGQKIENYIRANAYLGIPSLEAIAANFNTSPRSLQRKLREEGLNYQQLAATCRKQLALYYLKSGSHQIKEISYILGFNELSSFSRAFKQWTGKAPADYQKNNE